MWDNYAGMQRNYDALIEKFLVGENPIRAQFAKIKGERY